MTRELQLQFSKDGLKGKRAFSKTLIVVVVVVAVSVIFLLLSLLF